MSRMIWVFALVLFARAAATQTNQVTLEKRADGWWATWTNTPERFIISTSTNMVNWEVWMRKESGPSLKSMEMRMVNSNDFKFLKFEPYPVPTVSTRLTTLMQGLTNTLKSNQRKTK